MAVKIKLKRMGKIRAPHYRIIVADSRTRRDGRAIEEIGIYNPMAKPSMIKVNSERAQYWLGVGAQPTEPVRAILKATGDWQAFKGLPGAEGKLKEPEAKADKRAVYDAVLAEVHGEPKSEATTPKKKATKKGAAKKDDAAKDEAAKDEADAAAETAEEQAEAAPADEEAAKPAESTGDTAEASAGDTTSEA